MIYLILLLIPMCFSITEAKEPDSNLQTIELGKVDRLTISDGYYVSISHGDPSITISGDSNAIDSLNIEVNPLEVRISHKPQKKGMITSWFGHKSYNVDHHTIGIQITLPRLESIHLHGTANATIKEDLNIEKIELSGASKLDIRSPISPKQLDIELRGAAFLSTKGIKTNQLMIQQSGTSRSVLEDIKSREYTLCNISGRSAIEALMLSSDHLQIEGSGNSLYHINTIKSNQLTVELYGMSHASVRSLKADTVNTFLHGSSTFKANIAEVNKHYEHNTGISKTQYDELITP